MPPPPPESHNWAPGRVGFRSFNQILSDAINDLSESGYVDPQRIDFWLQQLRNAAERELGSEKAIDEATRHAMGSIYSRLIERGRVVQYVPDVSRFTLSMVRPRLRAELDRRILASADLIKLHRREAIEKTLTRFSGWSTSIPPGGAGVIDKREVRQHIAKPTQQMSFIRRRCETDQGHKLIANISEIVATDSGAIAAEWHSHGEHDRSYDARKEHLARAGQVFLVKGSWAIEQGIIRRGSRPYIDEIERPGQLVSCRCWYRWITSPRRLPEDVLTAFGKEWVARGRVAA